MPPQYFLRNKIEQQAIFVQYLKDFPLILHTRAVKAMAVIKGRVNVLKCTITIGRHILLEL